MKFCLTASGRADRIGGGFAENGHTSLPQTDRKTTMPTSPPEFPPRTLDQAAAEDALFPALMAGLFGGAAGVSAAAGLFGALVCVGLAKFFYGEYLRFKRRGYYACERKREEARRAFEAAVAELQRTGDPGLRKYHEAYQSYIAELSRIEKDYLRETGRSYWDGPDPPRRRNDEDDLGGRCRRESRWNDSPRNRDRDWSGTPWASPKAVASRRRRRERRMAAWREWARAFAEAVRLGKPPPLSPAERRTGGGAPVRRLCERSSSSPPAPEALLAQYDKAKGRGPVEEKIRLGSMMLDIEAAVDSSLVRDSSGEIVGRNAGVRGWLDEHCPELSRHYASLMGYRRLADEFRKVHGLRDPHPATRFLEKEFPADAFPPQVREAMRERHAAARRLLASPAVRTAKGFSEALSRTRRWGVVPRRRTG